MEPYATLLKAGEDELIPMFRLEDIQVVVVGGETNGYWRIMSSTYDAERCRLMSGGSGWWDYLTPGPLSIAER